MLYGDYGTNRLQQFVGYEPVWDNLEVRKFVCSMWQVWYKKKNNRSMGHTKNVLVNVLCLFFDKKYSIDLS